MKENTKRILLSLYLIAAKQEKTLTQDTFKYLLPPLTPSGLRSLLHLQEKNGYIESITSNQQRRYTLTIKGKRSVESLFPVLQSQDESLILFFRNAPAADLQFRNLRISLLKHNAISVQRGVYVLSAHTLNKVQQLLESLYVGHVYCVSVKDWVFGSETQLLLKDAALNSLNDGYSSISRESYSLLGKIEVKKRLMKKDKELITAIFNRFYQNLGEDTGISPNVFTSTNSAQQTFGVVGDLIQLVDAIGQQDALY